MGQIHKKIPVAVELRVRAECLDYTRRETALKCDLPPDIRAEYIRINTAIDEALKDTCDIGLILEMRNNIGNNCGWSRSGISFICKDSFYNIKYKAIGAIAKKLNIL